MGELRSVLLRMVLVIGVLMPPTVAGAHAVVLETIPADGALLDRAPEQIVIRFNEPVAPIAARVLDAEGRAITAPGSMVVEDRELRIRLPKRDYLGPYIAIWRVVSADSHPISGSVVFVVGKVAGDPVWPDTDAEDAGWRTAMVAVRAILYAGLLGGAGGVLFLLLVAPAGSAARATERIAAAFATLGAIAALAAIGIHGGQLAGGPHHTLASLATWRIGLQSPFGTTALLATVGLTLIAAALWQKQFASGRLLAVLGAAAALASLALSGHVATAAPRWLTVPALVLHTAAVAFWAGALMPLHRVIGVAGKEAAALVRRFSLVALGAVPLLIVAGVAIAVVQVASSDALRTTDYGHVLLVKLGIVTGLLCLAGVNKWLLTCALARGEARAVSALRWSIGAEAALVLAILVASAALSLTPPPRAIEAEADHAQLHAYQEPTGLWATATAHGRRAEMSFLSRRSGPNVLFVRLFDATGKPIDAKEVAVIAANPSAGVEPIHRQAVLSPTGAWIAENLLLIPAGTWTIRIEVLVGDFERARFEKMVELR